MTNEQEQVSYWRESASMDRDASTDLMKLGHYHWSLFVWHLSIEKLLKGLYVKEGKEIIYSHNLFRLAAGLPLELSEKYEDWLKEATTFNVEARYDSRKLEFYKKANKSYATEWNTRMEELYQWLTAKF